ncbi:hypothetical protein BDN70DRAFT_939631 [Pholiota conissans]|uniref:Uncharacterized protein n=1 Tax=Pholiota conissans TaxID=109636 RepID=A0A9P6CSF1_9AGAR|nr:hypothetical protein BDN70DRAFT_939631 [Pholiota conissans]
MNQNTTGANHTSSPTPAFGSARNPIRVDSPSFLLNMLDSLVANPNPVPGPNTHRNSAKGKSSAQNQVPLHEKPRAKLSAATRIRRKGKENANARVIIIHDTDSETDSQPKASAHGSSSSNAARKQKPAKAKIIVRGTDSDTDGLPSYPKAAPGGSSSSNAAPTVAALPVGGVFSSSNQPQSSPALRLPNVTVDSDSSEERYLAARAAIKRSKRAQPRRKNTKRSKTSSVRPPTGAAPADHAGLSTGTTMDPVTEPAATSSRDQPTHSPASSATRRPVSQPSILPAKLDIFSLQSPFNQIQGRFPRTPSAAATSGATSHNADSSSIPDNTPSMPRPNEKRFVSLFSDLDSNPSDHDLDGRDEVSPWFAQWLRTNAGKRYRANAVARRLFCDQPTANGNSTATVSSAVTTTSSDSNANATATIPVDSNAIAPADISTGVNTVTLDPAPTYVDVNAIIHVPVNTIAPAPVDVDDSAIVQVPVSTDGNTIAPPPISADGTTTAPGTADMSNQANENDGSDPGNEMGSSDYGISDLDADFLEEIGPFLDAVYVPPAVEDTPVAEDGASQDDK